MKRNTAYKQLLTAAQEARAHGYAVIVWGPSDVRTLRPVMDDETATTALHAVASDLEDRSVALGWGVLEILLDLEGL